MKTPLLSLVATFAMPSGPPLHVDLSVALNVGATMEEAWELAELVAFEQVRNRAPGRVSFPLPIDGEAFSYGF